MLLQAARCAWQFGAQLSAQGLVAFWGRTAAGSIGLPAAMDLVVAMPVSWLPLAADYARHGKSGNGSMGGTFIGYLFANIWCYALGVVVVSVSQPDAHLVNALLLAQGGLIALSLILVDEIDNAYGDVYSSAVSTHSLRGAVSIRQWGVGLAVLCTLLALGLPMRNTEPFLPTLSSVFVPLFGVILGSRQRQAGPIHTRKVRWSHAELWVAGMAVYHGVCDWAPQSGATLPTLLLTFAGARAQTDRDKPSRSKPYPTPRIQPSIIATMLSGGERFGLKAAHSPPVPIRVAQPACHGKRIMLVARGAFDGVGMFPERGVHLDHGRSTWRDVPSIEGPEMHPVAEPTPYVTQPRNARMRGLGHRALHIKMKDRLGRAGAQFGQAPPQRIAHACDPIVMQPIADEINIHVVWHRLRVTLAAGSLASVSQSV